MRVDVFDFALPDDRIALRPAEPRDSARMLVLDSDGTPAHAKISDLPDFVGPQQVMVVNDTRVIPARLRGRRLARVTDGAGANIELLLHRRLAAGRYSALARPAKRLLVGDRIQLGFHLEGIVCARDPQGGGVELDFTLQGPALDDAIRALGEMPLPPYIQGRRKADARDTQDYQTVFGRVEGSVAAPTAGLHFTEGLLERLKAGGTAREAVTLDIGLGTFLPVTTADTGDHRMHAEHARLDAGTAARLNQARAAGKKILAVGTTALRTLESAADGQGQLQAFEGDTDIFITPGYRFRAVDMLLTNFHLPRSTLFMLVCAFCGTQRMVAAYEDAIARNYRFYSYGDACLLRRGGS